MDTGSRIVAASRRFSRDAARLRFHAPVRYVYSPLDYAREPCAAYAEAYAREGIRVLFLGMNPGPWGMAQSGVPFGEISFVRDWMEISGRISPPGRTHARVPVLGFDCRRSEVSGRRFWGLMKERFGTARAFFRTGFAANYCPLMFLGERGQNLTPDKLGAADRSSLFGICDEYLDSLVSALSPRWIVGIGRFAADRAAEASGRSDLTGIRTGGILHPSPANPAANRNWAEAAESALEDMGAWRRKRAEPGGFSP